MSLIVHSIAAAASPTDIQFAKTELTGQIRVCEHNPSILAAAA
jgi:hypothetical protein